MFKRLSTFCIFSILFALQSNAQDYIKLSATCLSNGENKLANEYAKRAWSKKPSKYVSYLLAYANHVLDNYDTAAFYSGIALFDGTIYPDVQFTATQEKQLKGILQYYKELNQQRSKDLVSALYQGYPRLSIIRARLTLSNGNNQNPKDLERIAYLKEKEKALPTWEQYIDSLKKANIPDSIISQLQIEKLLDETKRNLANTPESISRELDEFYGTGKSDEFIKIAWIDSSIKNNSTNSYNVWDLDYLEKDRNPYKQKKTYDSYYYPELYEKREFLIYPMIKIYMNYKMGKIDSTNFYVKRYDLTQKNLESFYKVVFPSILKNKNSLKEFLKEYEP
jgi:hypothetical protein